MKLVRVGVSAMVLTVCGLGAAWSNDNTAPLSSHVIPLRPPQEATVSGNTARNLKHVSGATVRFEAPDDQFAGAATYSIDDPATVVNCPDTPAGNCVVTATVTVQIAGESIRNRVWLCALVDNKVMDPPGGCPFVGVTPTDLRYRTYSFSFAKYGVTPGNHRMQSRVGFDYTSYIGHVYVQYDVYK